jgi:hypothetical protein
MAFTNRILGRMNHDRLNAELKAVRLAAYVESRGGWPVPLAGATYWIGLSLLGERLGQQNWSLIAAVMSGAIFPLSLGYAVLFRNRFMKAKVPDQGVVFMAMGAMLLFWPTAVATMWNYNTLTPLILAIGMSAHWPVFGWSYGRPWPFILHVVVRAAVAFGLWQYVPDGRFTVLPAAIAAIYVASTVMLFIDSGHVGRRLNREAAAA